MNKDIITTGKNIDDAIDEAASQLGVDRDDLSVEIIDTPSKGFLGFGGSLAKVRAWVGDDPRPAEVSETVKTPVKTEKPKKPEKAEKPEKSEKPKKVKAAKAGLENDSPQTQIVDYFTGLCEVMSLTDIDVKAELSDKTLRVSLNGQGLGVLIGKRGETMYALQYLSALAVNKQDGQYIRVELDIEGYREKRTVALEKLALRMADKATRQRRNVALEYMQAYERRVIHSTLQNHRFVTTRSVGDEPFRKIIITYAPIESRKSE